MANARDFTQRGPTLRLNMACPRDRQINILLLGSTGVGKTTFINALANYLINDTLQEAEKDEIHVLIPASFTFNNPETFDDISIRLGESNEYELAHDDGQSNTQRCRSFVFPVGDRILRLIDTPGIGDTRGFNQDVANFQEILSYIAQYQHLNGICILLKPTEQRLNILFRFCINELLRHLHVDAKDNLIFLFTNARSTFFSPGQTKRLLDVMFEEHRQNRGVQIPFSRTNTFLFDNESFRYLAIRRHNITLDEDQTRSYTKSWNHSVGEYTRMIDYLVTRPLHPVKHTLSLNEAEKLVRKLPRPIAETARLIEENIQLAHDYKKKVQENPDLALEGIPQNFITVIELKHPRTVCMGDKCCRTIEDASGTRIEYISICHDECYLKGVQQETLYDPHLQDCSAMDPLDGFCRICDCHWLQHKHITYEYDTNRTHLSANSNPQSFLQIIDKRIDDLRSEQTQIQDAYKKLIEFLHTSSLIPVNNDVAEYLQYFIREEQMKKDAGTQNQAVIDGLEKIRSDFISETEQLKKAIDEQKKAGGPREVIEPEKIFDLVDAIYALPITGRQIKEQVEGIKLGKEDYDTKREIQVKLPNKAAQSKVMIHAKRVTSKE